MILHDAATLFVTVIDRAVLTVQLLAFVACVAVLAAAPLVAPGVKASRRRLYARLAAEHAPQAPRPQPGPKRRPVPSWAHTEPYDYDEAA